MSFRNGVTSFSGYTVDFLTFFSQSYGGGSYVTRWHGRCGRNGSATAFFFLTFFSGFWMRVTCRICFWTTRWTVSGRSVARCQTVLTAICLMRFNGRILGRFVFFSKNGGPV